MKKIKEYTLVVVLGLTFLEMLKFIILLVYFMTDNSFYEGIYVNSDKVNIYYKVLYMKLIPFFIYTIVILISTLKKYFNLLDSLLIFVITIFLFRIFDYRELLFFVSNHRTRLYVTMVLSIGLFLILGAKLLSLRSKRNSIQI